jgi:hypothetical protein
MSTTKDIESLIAILDDELAHLSSVYATYERLYRSDSDTRKLLSDSDSAFFSDLYIIYLNYISVAVSRLLDPEKTGKRSNLSIFTLIAILRADGHPEGDKLHQQLTDIKARAYNFTDPRNQLVSHLDYDAGRVDPGMKAIPSFIKSEFEEFHKGTGKLMNDIREMFGMPPNMHEWGVVGHGCGRKLLHRLKIASDHISAKISNKRVQPTSLHSAADA